MEYKDYLKMRGSDVVVWVWIRNAFINGLFLGWVLAFLVATVFVVLF